MKIKIISDGTSAGTQVLTEDGKPLDNIKSVTWSVTAGSPGLAEVSVVFRQVNVELVGEIQVVDDGPALGSNEFRKGCEKALMATY